MDRNILSEFGLTSNESDIFLALVKKGTLSATAIAKETGLNRPYVYYALERLLEKGYLGEIHEKGKKKFQAISGKQILALEEHKLDALKKLVEDMEKFRQKSEGDISVEVWKGKYALKNIFKKVFTDIKAKEEILYLGLEEEKSEELEPIYLKKLINYFKTNKITERIIIRKGGHKLSYATTTHYKHLDPELLGNNAKIIYQDNVIELIYGIILYAIVIQNQTLADTARKQFELFWSMAQK